MLNLLLYIAGAIPPRAREERGATAVEYALIVGALALLVAGVDFLKAALDAFYSSQQDTADSWVP